VFDLYKVHQDATYLPVSFSSPDYAIGDQKIQALNVSASRDTTGAIHITLVNLDPNKSLQLKSSLGSIQWKNVTGSIVTSAKVNDVNTFENPSSIRVQPFSGAKKQSADLLVELPPKSIVMLELK
jgi:alpha-N-arabinofuranosidase